MGKRFLVTVFIILLVTTLTEIGYYIYYKTLSSKNNNIQSSTTLATETTKSKVSAQELIPACIEPAIESLHQKEFIQKIAESLIIDKNKGIVKKMFFTSTWEGIVEKFIPNGTLKQGMANGTFLIIKNPENGKTDYPITENRGNDVLYLIKLNNSDSLLTVNLEDLAKYLVKGTKVSIDVTFQPDNTNRTYKVSILDNLNEKN